MHKKFSKFKFIYKQLSDKIKIKIDISTKINNVIISESHINLFNNFILLNKGFF
jgi:hypothetical protein